MPTVDFNLNPKSLASYIDHTLLRPDAREAEIIQLCEEAKEYGFKTVCIEAKWLSVARRCLEGSPVLPITVIGFPTGTESTHAKAEEAARALADGARELDMVIHRTWLFEKNYSAVFWDIRTIVETAGSVPVKVILETSELTDHQKIIACSLSKAAGARFVKTSTGFSKSGATEHDVRLMRDIVGEDTGVKASGGIRSWEDARKMIASGADRIGASASVAIIKGLSAGKGAY